MVGVGQRTTPESAEISRFDQFSPNEILRYRSADVACNKEIAHCRFRYGSSKLHAPSVILMKTLPFVAVAPDVNAKSAVFRG